MSWSIVSNPQPLYVRYIFLHPQWWPACKPFSHDPPIKLIGIGRSVASWRKNFTHLWHFNVDGYCKMQIHIDFACKIYSKWGVNSPGADPGKFWVYWVNIMAADALAPCLVRPSKAMILTVCNVDILIFLEIESQQLTMFQYWWMMACVQLCSVLKCRTICHI